MPIKVFDVRSKVKKDSLEDIKVRIGDWEESVPIKFLRISEMKPLEELLRRAYELGRSSPLPRHTGGVQQADERVKPTKFWPVRFWRYLQDSFNRGYF